MNKIYCIILDGAADRRIPLLGSRSPLEAAYTPNLDYFVRRGTMSMIEILPPEYVPETDSGLMALLGYDPLQYYCGRGALEAIGRGLYKQYQYFAGFRVNFASFDKKTRTLNRRTARSLSDVELEMLTKEIVGNITLEEYPGVSFELVSYGTHRGIFTLFSNTVGLSGNVTNTDPGFMKKGFFSFPVEKYEDRVLPCRPLDESQAAKTTASIVNSFVLKTHDLLEKSDINVKRCKGKLLPCNYLIFRDGGSAFNKMESFYKRYGKRLAIYGELPCEKALADLVDAEFHYSRELELQLDQEYLSQLPNILVSADADIVFCHLKGPDEPGHDHDPAGKVRSIEMIDQYFFKGLKGCVSDGDMVLVTCDHATPCELGIHSNDRVPLIISGGHMEADGTIHYDESNALKGKCVLKKAVDVMAYLIEGSSHGGNQ